MRVSGHEDVDADGMLTGPDGTWLDETATQATADLAVWSVPANSVLRQRPGHYYWQAYLTGDAANGAEEPIGPVQELTVTLPFADKGRGKLFPKYGRRGVRRASTCRPPGSRIRQRDSLPEGRQDRGHALGLKTLRWTSAKAGVQDGFNVAGFSSSVDAGVLGVQTDFVKRGKVVESDLASTPARTGTRARTIRRSTRSTSRASCCTSSAIWRATRSTRRAAPTRR